MRKIVRRRLSGARALPTGSGRQYYDYVVAKAVFPILAFQVVSTDRGRSEAGLFWIGEDAIQHDLYVDVNATETGLKSTTTPEPVSACRARQRSLGTRGERLETP